MESYSNLEPKIIQIKSFMRR